MSHLITKLIMNLTSNACMLMKIGGKNVFWIWKCSSKMCEIRGDSEHLWKNNYTNIIKWYCLHENVTVQRSYLYIWRDDRLHIPHWIFFIHERCYKLHVPSCRWLHQVCWFYIKLAHLHIHTDIKKTVKVTVLSALQKNSSYIASIFTSEDNLAPFPQQCIHIN